LASRDVRSARPPESESLHFSNHGMRKGGSPSHPATPHPTIFTGLDFSIRPVNPPSEDYKQPSIKQSMLRRSGLCPGCCRHVRKVACFPPATEPPSDPNRALRGAIRPSPCSWGFRGSRLKSQSSLTCHITSRQQLLQQSSRPKCEPSTCRGQLLCGWQDIIIKLNAGSMILPIFLEKLRRLPKPATSIEPAPTL
jgi:hypothetical protein